MITYDDDGQRRYTVKVYHSEKAHGEKVQEAEADEGGSDAETWRHGSIDLRPINPEFEVLSLSHDDEVAIVTELIEVL